MEETNNTQNTENTVAQGFSFYTEKDAELAEQERKKIDYLEEHLDYSQPNKILQLYNKAIHDRIFKGPVGMLYLRKLQIYLKKQESIPEELIVPIPLYQIYTGEVRNEQNPARNRVVPAKKKKSIALPVSIMLNIVLAIAVIAMFVITLQSDQPNILNYERVITDRYATWEQELTEREQTIREKERELKIQEPIN